MNCRIFLRPEAEQDLYDAASWYETHRSELGHRFLDEALAAFASIAESPLQYPELRRGIRRKLLKRFPFAVFFRVNEGVIVIIAVMHGSRDPKKWKDRT